MAFELRELLLPDSGHLQERDAEFQRVPRLTFITDGEPHAADGLLRRIESELNWTCRVPEYLEAVSL